MDERSLRFVQQQVEPVGVFLEVEDPDLTSLVDQLLGDPRSNTTVTARHQNSHATFPPG